MTLPPPITSRGNSRAKALRAALNGTPSEPGDLLGVEGETLIREAAASGVEFDTVYLREGSEAALDAAFAAGLRVKNWCVLSQDVFAGSVDTAAPQGVAATFRIPELAASDFRQVPGVLLVIESLQDPGNLGTLIRSAEAFGVKQIFTTPDTVNRWNPKAVRASAGSVFRVPVVRAPTASVKQFLQSFHYKLLAAVAQSEDATSVTEASLLAPCALMVGNEGSGLSANALALADGRIHIPCAVESLNAAIAGSTLMYEAMRQNRRRTAEGTA